uniref:Uncharacterized protein n=1 Tax=Rhizophora mucronata TaxID=61149 RepID=A0A2P2NVP6_RHIMU
MRKWNSQALTSCSSASQ